jgi:hypothetical protein
LVIKNSIKSYLMGVTNAPAAPESGAETGATGCSGLVDGFAKLLLAACEDFWIEAPNDCISRPRPSTVEHETIAPKDKMLQANRIFRRIVMISSSKQF